MRIQEEVVPTVGLPQRHRHFALGAGPLIQLLLCAVTYITEMSLHVT